MLTFTGRPAGRQRRGAAVTLYHATPVRNLASILRDGILTAKSQGRYKAVWLHDRGRRHWAALHTVRRHGGRIEGVVIVEVAVPRDWLRRHGGNVRGIWRSVRDIPPRCVRRVVNFNELSASPANGAA
jgi:hypothetical protein